MTIRFGQNLFRLLTGKDIEHEDVVAEAIENAEEADHIQKQRREE